MVRTKSVRTQSVLKPIIVNGVIPVGVHRKMSHRVSWRDEEGENKKDFKDPAILAAVPFGGINTDLPPETTVDYRYSKDELLKLRKAPTSQKRPDYLESAYYNQQGVWDPEPWHYTNKQAESHANSENGNSGPNGGDDYPAQGGGGSGGGGGKQRNRPSDPRERIRKEQDGIVLSPQRRSFNSGCFVPLRDSSSSTLPAIRPNRAHSPLGAAGVGGGGAGVGSGVKNDQHMTRRIGSGRILPWDYQEKTEENDFGYRSNRRGGGGADGAGERDRDRDERFERRSFGRDFDNAKESKHLSGRSQNQSRGYNRRISNESREEEPEWFSSGPISQNDTIELRGFDDLPERVNNKKNKPQNKRTVANNNNANGDAVKKQENKKNNSIKEKENNVGRSSPNGNAANPQDGDVGRKSSEKAKSDGIVASVDKETTKNLNKLSADEDCFNFDAILKADSIPGLLSNGIESGDAAGSRFSRWFKREKSPPAKSESRRSSLQDPDHHHIIKSLLGDSFTEPQTVAIPQPGDSESYFAPISPAASSHQATAQQNDQQQQQAQQQQQQQKSLNLMEMLQRGGANNATAPAAVAGGGLAQQPATKGKNAESAGGGPGTGKILSLEELEAKMRQGAPDKPQLNKASEEDMKAFKRLFPQMNVNGPAPQLKPMSLMEMLSHSQQKDADAAARIARMAHQSTATNLHPHMSDVAFKLQQVQSQVQHAQKQQQLEILAKIVNSSGYAPHQGGGTRASPLPELAGRELLNRPEAQAIMQGLKRGDITPQHLYQQLANPAMQPRHRDMLHTILKIQQQQQQQQQQQSQSVPQAPTTVGGAGVVGVGGMQPPPPPQQQAQSVSPNFYNTQQQLRVSPLPPNAYCVSPVMATSPNTLSVPALHQRIPSPRELQVHTQHIMQRALIKKKLEEQEENYRKKQQQQQQAQQQRGATSSPANKTASPTPLFMPTSVMRKLTAEKDDASKDSAGKDKTPQGRPLTGLRTAAPVPPQAQQPPNWNNHFSQQMKQPGRAIVKANNYQQANQSNQQQQEYFQQQQQQQQQQRLMHQQQQQMQQKQNYYNQPSQYQQLSQQQLRQQHQNVRAQHQQQQPPTFQHQQQQPGNWMTQGQNYDNHQMNRGDLSPTSDQLARWFSPDLLERARKGNVPSIPASAVAQHALSLEEIERQTTPVGHN